MTGALQGTYRTADPSLNPLVLFSVSHLDNLRSICASSTPQILITVTHKRNRPKNRQIRKKTTSKARKGRIVGYSFGLSFYQLSAQFIHCLTKSAACWH
ncbi:MAG: hypothetical protein IPH54_05465 [Rhodoferax sp.]|nr:hypothetical protein [Rhodoferax sp.]